MTRDDPALAAANETDSIFRRYSVEKERRAAAKKIAASIKKLSSEIAKRHVRIRILREACLHDECDVEYGSNTGWYDGPSYDRYWATYTCKSCGKTEMIDSGDPRYRTEGIRKP